MLLVRRTRTVPDRLLAFLWGNKWEEAQFPKFGVAPCWSQDPDRMVVFLVAAVTVQLLHDTTGRCAAAAVSLHQSVPVPS